MKQNEVVNDLVYKLVIKVLEYRIEQIEMYIDMKISI